MYFYIGRTRFTSKLSVTDCDRSPSLLSRDACYTLGVLKPCYTMEKQLGISRNSTDSTRSQVTPIHASKSDTKSEHSFLHQKLSNNSTKHSITREQLQGSPLTKQDILETYADIFTRIGKFPGLPYKFQLKPNAKPTRHAPRKVPIHLQDAFHENQKFETIWNIGRNKECYRVGEQLCNHGKEASN